MRVIEPRQFKYLKPVKRKKSYKVFVLLILIILLSYIGYIRYSRPLPDLEYMSINNLKVGTKTKFTWPENVQAAVGIIGKGLIASNNSDKSIPTASTAKIITALIVLDKKPLNINEDGPNIEITEQDQQIYDNVYENDGSRVLVRPGTVLSQKQALQALLLPSANNIAETLTNWAFGSQESYINYANNYLKENKLTKTVIADSSGFSPNTVSTASDMAIITELALKNSVIAEIVSQKQADIPVAGTINNTNWLLGKRGVNGVKTGHTDQAGGCFIVSANIILPNNNVEKFYGVILGASDIDKAMIDIQPLVLDQIVKGYRDNQVITKGQKLGIIKSAWGEEALIIASDDLKIYGWQEDKPTINLKMNDNVTKLNSENEIVGQAKVDLGRTSGIVKLTQNKEIQPPSFMWKFKRIFQ